MLQYERQFQSNREHLARLLQQQAQGVVVNPERIKDAQAQIARDQAHQTAIDQAEAGKRIADDTAIAAAEARQQERVDRAAEREMPSPPNIRL